MQTQMHKKTGLILRAGLCRRESERKVDGKVPLCGHIQFTTLFPERGSSTYIPQEQPRLCRVGVPRPRIRRLGVIRFWDLGLRDKP